RACKTYVLTLACMRTRLFCISRRVEGHVQGEQLPGPAKAMCKVSSCTGPPKTEAPQIDSVKTHSSTRSHEPSANEAEWPIDLPSWLLSTQACFHENTNRRRRRCFLS